METCEHCLNPQAETAEELDRLEDSPDAEPCPCITATCGHRLCAELDDHPPCEVCGLCEACCPCVCERCGAPYRARDECWACVAKSQTLREVSIQHSWPIEEVNRQAGQ
jgi:hypothetical protein